MENGEENAHNKKRSADDVDDEDDGDKAIAQNRPSAKKLQRRWKHMPKRKMQQKRKAKQSKAVEPEKSAEKGAAAWENWLGASQTRSWDSCLCICDFCKIYALFS